MIMSNNLGRQYSLHAEEYKKKACEVLDSGWYILGKEVSAFEEEWANYIGAKYCVGLASGLDALWISFRLLNIGVGDEVIVCANAYIACVMGITINGATPIFVEPDRYDNIDADKIEKAITPNTKKEPPPAKSPITLQAAVVFLFWSISMTGCQSVGSSV